MAKKNFIVVLDDPPDINLRRRIEHHYPEAYRYTDTVYLISANSITGKVAEKLGLEIGKNEHGEDVPPSCIGTVFRLGQGYSGVAAPSLWEWLADNRKENT